VFNRRGRILLIAGNAPAQLAGSIGPGSNARRLRGRPSRLMPGVWVARGRRGPARFVYGVAGGRVRFVAVSTRRELRYHASVRADLRAAGY
jgi:hypothetical protein